MSHEKVDWYKIYGQQPSLELQTKVQYKEHTHGVAVNSESCREALIYNIGDWMGALIGVTEDEDHDPTPWKKKKTPKPFVIKEKIQLNVESLRQAGGTKLNMFFDDDYDSKFCQRECCVKGLGNALNTLVSLPALLLNPDRYTGDWWEQTAAQITTVPKYGGEPCLTYWGADNSILRHPALVSIMFGLFRQATMMHMEGMLEGLERAVSPVAVREALFHSDEKAALKLVQRAEPWLFCGKYNSYFPISGPGKWELFLNLHTALYRHGFDEVFGDVAAAWELASRGTKTLSGSHSYFQAKSKVARIAELARKAA